MFGSFSRWSYEWTQFNQQEKHIQLQLFSCTVQVAIALFQLWMYKNHRKFLILFSGDCGKSLVEWVRYLIGRDMRFPHIKVIIPTAPSQPYTMLNGQVLFKSLYWLIFEKKILQTLCFILGTITSIVPLSEGRILIRFSVKFHISNFWRMKISETFQIF